MAQEIEQYLMEQFENDLDGNDKSISKIPRYSQFQAIKTVLKEIFRSSSLVDQQLRDKLYNLNNALTECRILSRKHGFYSPEELLTINRIRMELKQIKKDLKTIIANSIRGSNPNSDEQHVSDVDSISSKDRWTTRSVDVSKVYGFDDDVLSMEKLLVQQESRDRFKAIGVVGREGIGKTTLCQLVFNKPEVKDNFLPKMLQTVFNVNESYPDFSNVDWSKLRNLKVLHLGRWHSRAKHHIEVDDIEFLRGLIHLTHLRIFSLQGVSRIMELPDSVCKLLSLRILDLGACPNLELLPETIGSLKNLTHLDMSGCYLLERMPKGIAFLSELQVLKGFVVGVRYKNDTSCTFHDLSALKKLRKLSIHTSRANFPVEDELIVLQQFGWLRKLTIEWGRLSPQATTQDKGIEPDNVAAQPTTTSTQHNAALQPATRTRRKNPMISKLPTFKGMRNSTATSNQEYFEKLDLEKLDLQCYPQKTAISWLRPGKLKNLKKLYIRGGKLRNLVKVQENDDKWAVETLRLKFLSELEMDWKEIPVSFPDLIYLEKFRCPRLTFFPTDESGVWRKP